MKKVREINDWLLPEVLATPGTTALLLFINTDGWRKGTVGLAFRTVAAKHEGPVRFFRINTDENPSVLKEHRLPKHPSLILFVEGKEVVRRTESLDDRVITEMIARKETNS